jgi:pyruvate formate lyase activating enzyme
MNGQLYTLNYGKICLAAVDQIEKKPIFHYHPGSYLYSIGTFGCNLDCAGCQNFQLAKGSIQDIPYEIKSPGAVVAEALSKEVDGIAWTFNEPIIWSEYVIDTSIIAKNNGLFSMLNTNGFIKEEARDELLQCIDVMKIDIKGFSDDTYRTFCNGRLNPVLETCIAAKDAGIHVELAYLLVPRINDSNEEVHSLTNWMSKKMGAEVPLHFFRFSPIYKLSNLNQESMERMVSAKKIAQDSGLKYVYFGGTVSPDDQATYCPSCGELLISRIGEEASEKLFVKKTQVSRFCPTYSGINVKMNNGKCPKCGNQIKVIL